MKRSAVGPTIVEHVETSLPFPKRKPKLKKYQTPLVYWYKYFWYFSYSHKFKDD